LGSPRRTAFTLVELLIALVITSIIAGVMSGLLLAMQAAWQHTTGLQTVNSQARVACERMKYVISQAGIYQLSGQSTQLGMAVVARNVAGYDQPENLVVWCGGRGCGMAAAGLLNRLPLISELLIYAPDPADLSRFVEIAFPGNTGEIDFRGANFASTILSLVNSSATSDRALLTNQLRVSNLGGPSGPAGSRVACVRFDLFETPSASDLTGVTPGTSAWTNLTWTQGIMTSDSGLRQANVRLELQLKSRPDSSSDSTTFLTSLPFLGSASYRYVYFP
jgi:prepilin-type N-terminal cleavage/methylation domain-containing protein